jgi:hypothetical protein
LAFPARIGRVRRGGGHGQRGGGQAALHHWRNPPPTSLWPALREAGPLLPCCSCCKSAFPCLNPSSCLGPKTMC